MPNLVGIGNSQVPTNAMLGGLAYQDSVGEINIDKIKARTSDTAVDIFVYDTRKDSDGGAWRHRTQNLSWYNEGANTSRGARKEFPTVAVIVSTSSNLIIYDGDDPNLSMWMVFKGSSGWLNGAMPAALSAKNGIITVGSNTANQRLRIVFLLKDYCEDWATANSGGGHRASKGNFLGRNSDSSAGRTLDSTIGIVNRTINGVAMTVLQNAPIDIATGLPVPTIAIATDGGTNVIKDDGTVTQGYQTIATENVDLHPSGYMTDGISGATNDSFSLYEIGSTTRVAAYGHRAGLHPINTFLNEGTGECLFEGSSNEIAIAQSEGLLRIKEELFNYTSGLHNRTTTSYNTGWMTGSIKGAYLADTNDTNLTSTNLVSNGTFDSGISGWSTANATMSHDSGRLKMVSSSGNQNVYTTVTCVVGEKYYFQADFQGNVSFHLSTQGDAGNDVGYIPHVNYGSSTTKFLFFTATQTTMYLVPYVIGTNNTGYVDNVLVCLADHDRSVNGAKYATFSGIAGLSSGLQVFGTITKEPVATGAELVSYSGFNGSNYLRQPYNSDLNFGTGDFSIIVWVKKNTFSTNHYIIDRSITSPSWGGASGRSYFIINASGYHRFSLSGGNEQTGTAVAMPTGVFTQIGFVRRSGAMEFYMNGELVQTITGSNASASFDSSVTTQTMTVNRYANGFAYDYTFDGMALLRIAGTAPSAGQMKKIYDDEKCLFHENAKCTLHGTSDAVTALAHDDTTNILHVGTSGGRNDFLGLNRINNTTTAVTTAISASNKFVAEQ